MALNVGISRAWLFRGGVVAILAIGLIYSFMPRAIPVDMTDAARAGFEVSIRDDGYTRVRDVYEVSSPVPGRVLRFEGDVGDEVIAGTTVIATILPADPSMLDVRTRSSLESNVRAAEAAYSLAEADVARAEAAVDYARTDYQRNEELTRRGAVSEAALDRAELELRTQRASLQQAQAALRVREFELETARAALIGPEVEGAEAGDAGCCVSVRAPVSGRILRIFHESESVVQAGQHLFELGDPQDLEIIVDLLSTDAVRVSEGDAVVIERWGGEGTLNGRVDRIEPYGFTKISSLGIEEQRVNVVISIVDPVEQWQRLGHGYRIEARVVLWRGTSVLQVPLSALFRDGDGWSLFTVQGGRARMTSVEIGQLNPDAAEITAGLEEGTAIILHPSDRIEEGILVEQRNAE